MDSQLTDLIRDLNRNQANGTPLRLERYTIHTVDKDEFVIEELFASEKKIEILSTTGRYIELLTSFYEDMERYEDKDKDTVFYTY